VTDTAIALSPTLNRREQWFALQVRPNHERVVQGALRTRGYAEFLPLYRKRSRWSDRVKDIDLPLFPGYIFSNFDPDRRLPILTSPGVVSIVGVGRHPEPVNESELNAVRRFVESRFPIMPWPFLQAGDLVVIEQGSLAGLEGILVETKGQYRVVVSLGLLQRSVSVEIDRSIVRCLPARKRLLSAAPPSNIEYEHPTRSFPSGM
jgi:transcription antitermination factor NusG